MQRAVRARTGWASEERDLMWDEVRRSSEQGGTLKHAFDAVSEKTGRRPNSIRNYYYQSLREQNAPEELCSLRARPFVPFREEEIDALLRAILADRARGVSVRACVQRLGGGDRSLALRYQNKYRSILKNRPEYIGRILEELRAEGIDCQSPYDARPKADRPRARADSPAAEDAAELLDTIRRMIGRGETRSEMHHREEIDRMTVRMDLLRLELARREEMLLEARRTQNDVRHGSYQLMEICRELLSAKDIRIAKALRGALAQNLSDMESCLARLPGEDG